jgi:hypothetical protein
MTEHSRRRAIALIAIASVVVVIGLAIALGGSGGSGGSGSGGTSSAGTNAQAALSPQRLPAATGSGGSSDRAPSNAQAAPSYARAAPSATEAAGSGAARVAAGDVAENISDGVTATRVVKTGRLGLQVARNQVQPTISRLVALTTGLRGYVSTSTTSNELGSPTGEVTLRVPAAGFDTAVNDAEKLGHVQSLTTNATDVTGRYVDLGARLSALRRTRSTYLTILGGAHTIGATLSVQQRLDDVQQQIEELQGQLKVLANQSTDGTLTVDVTTPGVPVQHLARHHRSGLSAAWHRSISRFERGGDAIVGALGPLLLAVLILGVLAGIAALAYRGVRRAPSS